jgi:AcrR family transcriptional regulator
MVIAATVTRGALYFHFTHKRALFDALVEEIAAEILAAIEAAAARPRTKLEGLIAGCRAYLEICLSPAIRRIYVVDAPSVLGPKRMREIDAQYAQGSLREGVEDVLKENPVSGVSAEALTALLSGALDEAVLYLMAHEGAAARQRLYATLEAMIRRTFKA